MGCGEDLTSFDESLEAVFEFALNACSSLQQCEVEAVHLDVAQRGGHVTLAHAQREAFDDGGFPYTCLAGQDGVVLTAAHEDVDDLTNLEIAPEDGIDLAGLGFRRKVFGVLVEVLRFAGAWGPRRSAFSCSCGSHCAGG